MSEALEPRGCDSLKAQLLDWIADEPGISTAELADRLHQSRDRTGKHLARLRKAGQLTALIPKSSSRPYRWTLANYSPPTVEWPPEPEPKPIAATPKPKSEPVAVVTEPEPIIENGEGDDDDEEAGFSVATLHSAKLPTGLTEEDMAWHRYWHSRAVQRDRRLAELENT